MQSGHSDRQCDQIVTSPLHTIDVYDKIWSHYMPGCNKYGTVSTSERVCTHGKEGIGLLVRLSLC